MTLLLAFLAGGAFFIALEGIAGPFAAVLAAGVLTLSVIVGEAWTSADAAARGIVDRQAAQLRWLAWHWHDAARFIDRGRRG